MSNINVKPEPPMEKWVLPRRDFLVLGSAAAIGAAASTAGAATLRAVVTPASGSVLSVGFAEPVAAAAMPATALRIADGTFRESGARLLVHGFGSPRADAGVSVRLSTFAPTAEGPVPFLAWSHNGSRSGASRRAPFLAALDEDGTLPLAIERTETPSRWSRLLALPQAGPASTFPDLTALEQSGSVCRLSSGDRGDVRLRAGTYFIALRRSSGDRQPNWRTIEVETTPNGMALHRNGVPVDFEYVAVTVDYPTA